VIYKYRVKKSDLSTKNLSLTLIYEIHHMGTICIEEMEFYSFHGHFREERIVGNKFLVDLTIETDMKAPKESDNLKDAVNYQKVYEIVKHQMEIKSHLLEHIAGRILDALYTEMEGIKKVTVKVSKINPPMGGKIGSVSVIMSR
jgi:7,8-dihydroneopterin aldolase/epimerase/oxygenase